MLCLVIDFKMRKFSGFFICLRSLGKKEKTKEHSINDFPKSVVPCSQQFCGLPEMVKNPFWYKKYKHINCLKGVNEQFYVSCILAIIAYQIILGKYFKTLGGCFWHLAFIKFWFLKKENYCNVGIPPLSFLLYVSRKPWKF